METKVPPSSKEHHEPDHPGEDSPMSSRLQATPTTPQAVEEYNMIRDGDRVLVCLSGGKDSLSLLHTLRQYQFVSEARGVRFSLGAVTVDPGSTSYNPRPLIPYLAALNLPYFYEEQGEQCNSSY